MVKEEEKELGFVKLGEKEDILKGTEKGKDIMGGGEEEQDMVKLSEKEKEIMKLGEKEQDMMKLSEKEIVKLSEKEKEIVKLGEKEKDIVKLGEKEGERCVEGGCVSCEVVKVEWIGKEMLMEMLKRENAKRLLPETQRLYEEAERRVDTNWMKVTERLQREVVREFGVTDPLRIEEALYAMRTAHLVYPKDPRFREVSLWVKYNKTARGDLRAHQKYPDVDFLHLHEMGTRASLSGFCLGGERRPVVLVAGSYT
eukprot:TRINITY_DN2571_c0_g1_i2.p2 TRINITY_DN2571_c0_g1~~TRINITY_DN2571_c0_g1_i2.p2  ORF type:complete len:255 (-),score=91.80 TRINITY_DN2571_c0_g1_i2:520-1284(-)